MRILHVIGRLDFADGGPPVVATHLAAAQAHLGHQVGMVCYSCPADEQADQQLAQIPHWEKVALHRLPRPSRIERFRGRDAMAALGSMIAAADAIHLHNVWEIILLRAAAIARAAGKPYLIIANGMLDPWSLSQKAFKKRLALFLGYRRMLNGSVLHLLNENEKELIQPLGLHAQSVIIPNGVALEEIDPLPPRGEFRNRRPELRGRRFILFLSRLHYKKGLDYLADAFALVAPGHRQVDLVVAGPDGGARDDFHRQIAAAGLAERVHLVGPLYGRDKIAAMADCDCFVLPSRQEGFSIAILEAMACRAAVVISQACHFQQVADVGAGEVVELNSQALAAALDRMLGDATRDRFGTAGRALVESQYTWDRVAQQTIAVYQNARSR